MFIKYYICFLKYETNFYRGLNYLNIAKTYMDTWIYILMHAESLAYQNSLFKAVFPRGDA